ncbi:MAG: hypothetical protein OXC11_02280, partial [Rhodospirillales bacterium]|nr:hypothetical protein [Rhodospirillales bacterium]
MPAASARRLSGRLCGLLAGLRIATEARSDARERLGPERREQRLRRVLSGPAGLLALAFLTIAFWSAPYSVPEALAAAGNATGKPAFGNGSVAQGGQQVTATRGNVADPDGINDSTLSYTWLRCDVLGNNCSTEIGTGTSYTLSDADVGLRLRVRVDFTDSTGGSESLTSYPWPSRTDDPIAAVGANVDATGGPAVASGSIPQSGREATATLGSVADSDGIDESTLGYTWLRCDLLGNNCDTEIGTGASYTLADDDVGLRLRVRVDFTDNSGHSESRTSFPWPARTEPAIAVAITTASTTPVTTPSNPGNAGGNPLIVGEPMAPGGSVVVDRRAIWDSDGIRPNSFETTWFRCDADGVVCTTIPYRADVPYVLTAADLGSRLKARV